MIIDAHAHVVPKDYPADSGFPTMTPVSGDTARDLAFGSFGMRLRDAYFEVERRIEAMDDAAVDAEVISPMPPLLNYTIDSETARSLHRYVNEKLAGLAEAGAGRIHALGMVPLQDPAAAADELTRVRDLGLRGIEVGSHVNGVAIGDSRFLEVFQEAERLGLVIFVHTLPRADEVGVPPQMRASIGVGIEASRGAASIAFGDHPAHCALTNVMFSHAAGGFPAMVARADYFWETTPAESRSAEKPSSIARRFSYDSMVFDPRGLRFLIDYIGADRVMLGTDFPAMNRPAQLADLLEPLDLDPAAYAQVASDNCLAWLSLTADRV
ncbi:amidohydrolase family protein [Microbacterium lushaniae]|uniref:Amidohydrolase n=1 Tax=Microbacterium lushaniae TaxID=2614639 RepID=A0A5J6L4A0_9MICO|nr:amidohydrolase family protein [Microbacterium lushaniae]QEW03215.1 amidohydrolase [Microbacterium lushaniae]